MPPLYKSSKQSMQARIPLIWWSRISRVRTSIKRFSRWNCWKLRYPGNEFSCPYCKKEFGKFISYVNPYEISAKADIISGQTIAAHSCPYCLSGDRERTLYFFIQRRNGFLTSKTILHFAPERNFYTLISSADYEEYICADLDPERYSYPPEQINKIDITNIDYPDESFDIIICNHVLEHVPDDKRAMREMFRVLKKSGVAILLVPIGAKLKETYEDSSKATGDERSVAFGQCDHVRIYAENNYIERLKVAGFEVEAIKVGMSAEEIIRYGINSKEKLYLGFKSRAANEPAINRAFPGKAPGADSSSSHSGRHAGEIYPRSTPVVQPAGGG